MQSNEVRKKYIDFFKAREHVEIPSAPLVPQNDPTTLFTGSGMQPMVPYLLGETHPEGTRIVDSQKCFRAQDIDEVGNNRHTTFFEMLGNWSFGDYFKKKQLSWLFEFLTKELELDPQRLFVTVFEGNEVVPKDTESIDIWKEIFAGVGIDAKENERIFAYPASKNWWSRAGEPDHMPPGEPGGPDSEVFFDFGIDRKIHENSSYRDEPCHPNCDCGRFMEIANSVFMQYKKESDGSLKELAQKNVDFGGGLERMVAATNDDPDVFKTDLFTKIIETVEEYSDKKYSDDTNKPAIRIIADHLKAATFLIVDGVVPSNKEQGYVLRRLLRRSAVKMHSLHGGLTPIPGFQAICESILRTYEGDYFDLGKDRDIVDKVIEEELSKFHKSLDKGLREIQKIEYIDGKKTFDIYQTYGFPLEITAELFEQKGQKIDVQQFRSEFEKHRELSRTASKGMFKGGLADHSEQTIKLHTAHHLLLAALQKIVDPTIKQRGSNITSERLRMDFNLNRSLTPEEKEKVDKLVNEKITEKLTVKKVVMKREDAEKVGAQMEFGYKYPDQVNVYFIGLKNGIKPEEATSDDYFSAEFCGGPHVENTGVIGHFKILKEEALGSGVRRIYAKVS